MVPPFGRIRWRVKVTESVRLGFHNLNVVVRFRIKRVSLRGNAIAEQLAALLVVIPIQLVNLQNRAGTSLRS